uniref:Transposase (Putative), gypsy type n=1 Tax=Tanacetum cinerariifolium TaxID=118510 RepID=A0A6L2P123_TANCI|nr:hypothetical protein [Tanacetum cinerariifolium]
MGRDTVQLETAVSTISQEYLLEFTSEYGISEALHPELPGPEDRIVDFPEGKAQPRVDLFQQEAWEKYPAVLHQALRLSKKIEQPLLLGGRESVPNYRGLAYHCFKRWHARREYIFPRGCESTGHTPCPNPKTTRGITLLSGVKPQILPRRRDMDLFNLIYAPNPTKVKTGSRPRVAYEVPLLTVTANRVIEKEDPTAATDSSGVPSIIERSPLDFANENPLQQSTGPEDQEIAAPEVPPPRTDHADPRPTESTRGGKCLAAIKLGMGSTRPTLAPQGAPADVSDTDPLSFADPQSRPSADVAQSSKEAVVARDPKSENTSFASMVGSPENIYQPEWGITNSSMLNTLEASQDLVAPPGYFSDDGVATAVEVRARSKVVEEICCSSCSPREMDLSQRNEIKNLETLLEAEADMKKAAEDKSVTLQEQVSGEEKLKAAFEEVKQYEDNRVEQRCAEMDAYLDALSIDFDEELYYNHRGSQVDDRIAKGMSKGLKYGVEHGQAQLYLEAIEAYDPEAEAKYIAALQALKSLKYPLVDQLDGLKDAPMDVIIAFMNLESDTGDDALQWVRELRPSSS